MVVDEMIFFSKEQKELIQQWKDDKEFKNKMLNSSYCVMFRACYKRPDNDRSHSKWLGRKVGDGYYPMDISLLNLIRDEWIEHLKNKRNG